MSSTSWPWLKICSTCVHLDPTEHKLRALFDNLDRHQETFKKGALVPRGKRTHITKQTGKIEIPTARCHDTLNGHELTLAQAPNDAMSRLTVTVLAIML
jgi:hypothetical protein